MTDGSCDTALLPVQRSLGSAEPIRCTPCFLPFSSCVCGLRRCVCDLQLNDSLVLDTPVLCRYFLSRLRKVKKANGQILAINEVRRRARQEFHLVQSALLN